MSTRGVTCWLVEIAASTAQMVARGAPMALETLSREA